MKTITIAWLAVAMTALLLVGCTPNYRSPTDTGASTGAASRRAADSVPGGERVATATGIRSESDSLIDYYLAMRKAPKEKVLREHADANREIQTTPNAFNRIKLALLLSLPVTGLQDSARALNLLQDTIKEEKEEENALRNLANLLQAQLYKETRHDENMQRARDDQKRLESLAAKQDEAIQALTVKLKDEQKRYDTLQTSIQTKQEDNNQAVSILAQKLKDEQKRADNLQQKLDALANIEKTLIERQQQAKPEPKK
jgi:chromosome segregation ATPase